MYRQIQQEDPRNEILLAMLMVDQQRTGFISVAELQAKLMNLGEKLSKDEGESHAKTPGRRLLSNTGGWGLSVLGVNSFWEL